MPISQNLHGAAARAPFSSFRVTMLKPSWGHPGSILCHFSVTTSEDGRCIADFAKCARRLHESTILWFLRPNLWPLESFLASSWDHLEASSGHLGSSRDHLGSSLGRLGATLGPLGERTDEGIANLAKFALCLHESTILESSRSSNWNHVRAIFGHPGAIPCISTISPSRSPLWVYRASFQCCDF